MSFISIEIIDNDSGMEWYIPLERRITILRGDSGKGKTEMVNIIRNRIFGVNIKSELPLVVVDSSNWEILMLNSEESILIFDDMVEPESLRFSEIIKKTESKGNYYLIIGREYIEDKNNTLSKLSYSIKSILKLKTDKSGKKHTVDRIYELNQKDISCIKNFVMLTEDTSAGFKFFKSMLGNVVPSSNGKSSITQDSLSLLKDLSKDKTLVILFDVAAFGCHIDEFYNKVLREYSNVVFDLNFECFEYFLLSTNYIKFNSGNFNLNKFISLEKSYSEILIELTSNTRIKYIHKGKLRECWYTDCDSLDSSICNDFIKSKCNYYVKMKKFEYLLKNTIFEYYLDIINDNLLRHDKSELSALDSMFKLAK